MADASAQRIPPPSHTLLQHILYDRVLLTACAVCVLLFGYQLSVILLQPPWIKPATDWLRTALAWPQLLVVTWVAVCAVRIRGHDAVAWCCLALGMLSYAVARTTWTLADLLIFPHGVPFPSLPDLFFILQYPFFIAGMLLIPAEGHWLPRVRTLLDAVLWMSAVTALSWYFVLLPIARETGELLLSKTISMYYQVSDLVLFYGLVMALARPRRTTRALVVISLISLAAASLFVADTWAAVLLLHPPHTYRTGSWPDLFWFTCYLLFALAAVVRLRLTPAELPAQPMTHPEPLRWRDLLGGMAFVAPSFAVVGASMLIIVHATLTAQRKGDLMLPDVVSIALLLLAALRPGVLFLEEKQLRRERDAARIQEGVLRLANARMETFMSMVAHELKTPLTTLIGNVHLMGRRLDVILRPETTREDATRTATVLRTLVTYCEQSLERMRRLVEDVVDETRVQQGRLTLRLEPCDLVSVVGQAVAEQQALNPERSLRWVAEASPVWVLADTSRIEQVVANFVSNGLKFSHADGVVEVRVQTQDGQARVSVHDEGVGIPLAEQSHIWEQFYQAPGVEVQSGSQVGVGMGLYISKALVEGHHGRVGVASAPGRGTTLWFTLPLVSPPAASAPEEDAHRHASLPVPNDHAPAQDGRTT